MTEANIPDVNRHINIKAVPPFQGSFFIIVHPLQAPRFTQGRGSQNEDVGRAHKKGARCVFYEIIVDLMGHKG